MRFSSVLYIVVQKPSLLKSMWHVNQTGMNKVNDWMIIELACIHHLNSYSAYCKLIQASQMLSRDLPSFLCNITQYPISQAQDCRLSKTIWIRTTACLSMVYIWLLTGSSVLVPNLVGVSLWTLWNILGYVRHNTLYITCLFG